MVRSIKDPFSSRNLSFLLLFIVVLFFPSGAEPGQLTLTWNDNSTNENGFAIQRKLGTNGTYTQIATVGTNTTSYVDTGLTTGASYCYKVDSFNAAGTSPFSNESCGIVPTSTNFTLGVTKSGTGGGTVSSSPAGINCGGTCAASFS